MISGGKSASDRQAVCLRRMSPADVTDVLVILHESPEAAMWSVEALMESTSPGSAWIAESDGEPAGFLVARVAADEFEILNLAVKPAFRRRGIALRLMNEAFQCGCAAGARRAYLEVRGSNAVAIALYSRLGFTECGRRSRYYQYPVEDAVVLSLVLK